MSVINSAMRAHAQMMTERRAGLTLVMTSLILMCSGCGASHDNVRAQQSCERGQRQLRARVAPEFNKLISATSFPITPPQKYGCVMIFTRVLEEIPGEVVGEYISSATTHEVAFLMTDYEGREVLTFPTTPSFREGVVTMSVKLMEVFGGGNPEVVIEESGAQNLDRSRGVRIFMYAEGIPVPREIFSEALHIKSESGRKIPVRWGLTSAENLPAILFEGGGKQKLYLWNDSLQSYRFDPNVTRALTARPGASSVKASPRARSASKTTSFSPGDPSPFSSTPKATTPKTKPRATPKAQANQDDYKFEEDSAETSPPPATAPKTPESGSGENVTTVEDLLEGL